MTLARIAPIVEGHGEVAAVRGLLQRIWVELLMGEYLDVLQPIRQPRSRLISKVGLQKAVDFAAAKLANAANPPMPKCILILIDADNDAACRLGPTLLEYARESHSHCQLSAVVATIEYETWFVGGATSLKDYLEFVDLPTESEQLKLGKGWIDRHFKGVKYSETVDQPALTAKMNLPLCRSRCPSFDKLCRDLETMKILLSQTRAGP